MDAAERDVYQFLKGWKTDYVSVREICRRAGGKSRYREDQNWAKPVINRMMERGIIESDGNGHYRLKAPKAKEKMQRWVAPQIAEALKSSGKGFETIIISEAELEDYYDKL